MRRWMIPLLQCVECKSGSLEQALNGIACKNCGRFFETDREVTSFFSRSLNLAPQKEMNAIHTLDQGSSPDTVERIRSLLRVIDREKRSPSEPDLKEFTFLQHLMESKEQIEEVLEKHPLSDGSVLLEIGADHCWASNLFLDRGCQVIALDISDHLHLASRAEDENLCRIKADMNQLPLENHSVDIVWTTSAAHHSWDLKQTFLEAARVLKPNGRLFLCCEPIPSWLRYPFGHDFGHEERLLGINECWISRGSWMRFCREAGFHKIELMFPNLSEEAVRERLRSRNLPVQFAPLLRPFMKALQVSIHLLARKRS